MGLPEVGAGEVAAGRHGGVEDDVGSMPLAHCASNSVSSSVWARCWSYQHRPIATNAESQLHWCGYRVREGTVEAPSQLSSSTALAAASSSAASAPVNWMVWVVGIDASLCYANRLANTVKASRKVSPISANSPVNKRRAVSSGTLPCSRVPSIAPVTAPGTAHTSRFQGIAARPPAATSGTRWWRPRPPRSPPRSGWRWWRQPAPGTATA